MHVIVVKKKTLQKEAKYTKYIIFTQYKAQLYKKEENQIKISEKEIFWNCREYRENGIPNTCARPGRPSKLCPSNEQHLKHPTLREN